MPSLFALAVISRPDAGVDRDRPWPGKYAVYRKPYPTTQTANKASARYDASVVTAIASGEEGGGPKFA